MAGCGRKMTPLAIDLYAGLGGWADGFLEEGYRVIGFDIERHDYGTGGYPGQLVLQDVLTLHGSQFKNAAVIVASPPCQAYSYRAMPWKRAKALPPPDNALFDACFRIQREACEAAGHHIPMIVENVRGAQPWVGRAKWNFGSYYLWGDVPALMPMSFKRCGQKTPTGNCSPMMWKDREVARYAHPTPQEMELQGFKVPGFRFDGNGGSLQTAFVKTIGHVNKRDGFSHTRHLTNQRESDAVKQPGISGPRSNGKGDRWWQDGAARHGSKSTSRKAASAMIAKIPFALASHIARCFKPTLFVKE